MIRLAKMEEVPEIYREFYKLEKKLKSEGKPPIFGFIRKDYLQRCVQNGILYYDEGIIAVVKQYQMSKKKYGISVGDWSIPEIFNAKGKLGGAGFFFQKVLQEKVKDAKVFTTIRDDNVPSVKWHLKMGYKKISPVFWSKKKKPIPGGVYVYDGTLEQPSDWFKEK